MGVFPIQVMQKNGVLSGKPSQKCVRGSGVLVLTAEENLCPKNCSPSSFLLPISVCKKIAWTCKNAGPILFLRFSQKGSFQRICVARYHGLAASYLIFVTTIQPSKNFPSGTQKTALHTVKNFTHSVIFLTHFCRVTTFVANVGRWQDNLAPDNLAPGQFGTGQFGTRTIWHQHNETENLASRKKYVQIIV